MKKMYYLTPNAFKICLMCTQKRATQETQSLVQKYVEPLLKKVVQEPIPRDDIEFNEEPPILTDSEYYLTQLYRFIKSQNAPLIVQRFVETYA